MVLPALIQSSKKTGKKRGGGYSSPPGKIDTPQRISPLFNLEIPPKGRGMRLTNSQDFIYLNI